MFWDLQKQIYACYVWLGHIWTGGEKELDHKTWSDKQDQGSTWEQWHNLIAGPGVPVLQISLQFALHFAQRARSWHTFVCIIKALVPLDTIVLASLKDLSYHKKKKKIHPLISIGTQRFPKKERKKILKEKGAQIGSMKQNQWEEIVRFCLERVIKPKGLFAWHKGKHRFFLYEWQ